MSTIATRSSTAAHATWSKRKSNLRWAIPVCVALAGLGGFRLWNASLSPAPNDIHNQAVWQEVTRSDLDVIVLERGSLESQASIDVFCEVEDVRKDNINGTTILWMVPNGQSVKQGDLLIELDSTPMQEALDEQILYTENALSDKIQAEANLKNQLTMNATVRADAELQVELAELELEMYVDKENGTHKLTVEANKRRIDDVNNEILSAQATMELRQEEQRGIQSLFKLGYASRNEVRRIELTYLQAEAQFAAKLNQLQSELALLKKTEIYEQRKELLRLEGNLATAKRSLEQVLRNNEAKLAQVQAIMRAEDESYKKEKERLDRYQTQLAKCKIYAPQSGLVAYPISKSYEVREGLPALFRQRLLSIPNLDSMQVETSIHESALDQVRLGLPVRVTVDAFPNRSYRGTVTSVGVLPEQNSWSGSDTKVYETIVTIDEKVADLKPGMTAVAEIMVDSVADAITVPLHAVVEHEDQTYVVVRDGKSLVPRPVALGKSSETRVSVEEGLEAGEAVAVNAQEFLESLFMRDAASSPAS